MSALGAYIDVPQDAFELPLTPLTSSDISVIPPSPTPDAPEVDPDVPIRILNVVEAIEIDETTTSLLKPSIPFQIGGDNALERIEHPAHNHRRKALLIGIKYDGITPSVEGAHNDVDDMRNFLINHYGWQEEDITILKDDGRPTSQPTRDNIIFEMRQLVLDVHPGDRLFLHYSGHGGQIIDTDGDESDGLDEVIFSCDKYAIVDDEMHDILVKPLPAGCRFTALFDCCSSGTSLDLPIMEDSSPRKPLSSLFASSTLESSQIVSPTPGGSMLDLPHQYGSPSTSTDNSPPQEQIRGDGVDSARPVPRRKHTAGDVIMWSSCHDSERSYEVMDKDRKMKGAMTHAFIECLGLRRRQTYRELLDALNEMLLLWGCPQRPMMSSARRINMSETVSL